MKHQWIWAAAAIAAVLQMPSAAQAFECPTHFAEARLAIEKAAESVNRMTGAGVAVAQSHLREARMSLVEALYHHTRSRAYHHARAILRANDARGHAIAADIVSRRLAKQ